MNTPKYIVEIGVVACGIFCVLCAAFLLAALPQTSYAHNGEVHTETTVPADEMRVEKMQQLIALLTQLVELLSKKVELEHGVGQFINQTPAYSADERMGMHIMSDGTVMLGNGEEVSDATITVDDMIELADGTEVTPVFDLRDSDEVTASTDAEVAVAITASNFDFSVKQITVKKGAEVTITLANSEGFHDWVLDEFGASTERINGGEETTVTFTADEVGTFQYYCSVGTHREKGMVGYLVVTES